ncbi:MAG: hypothetical protein M1829_004482 [Trizodia sp. TS-e1964]|nr:MAG: hypothetical protein M1829_004482 [Trizodia sp. TS-e1964]
MATSPTPPPTSVLFVCLGNICRSTLAEGVFRHLTSSNPRIGRIDSAGTSGYHIGASPDARTMRVLAANGIRDYRHGARKLEPADFLGFDYIFAMDRMNLRDIQQVRRRVEASRANGEGALAKVLMWGDFGGTEGEEVEDPYYGGIEGFEIAYQQMLKFTNGFLAFLDNQG